MFITPPKIQKTPKSLFFLFMCIHEICFFIFHFSFFICFVILVLLSTPSRLTVCRRGGKFWRHCTQTAVDIGVEQLCFFDVRGWMWVSPPPFIFFCVLCPATHRDWRNIKKKTNFISKTEFRPDNRCRSRHRVLEIWRCCCWDVVIYPGKFICRRLLVIFLSLLFSNRFPSDLLVSVRLFPDLLHFLVAELLCVHFRWIFWSKWHHRHLVIVR